MRAALLSFTLLFTGLLAAPAVAHAQAPAQAPERSRFSGTAALLNTQPLDGLRTGPGFGLAGSVAYALDPAQVFRIRGDVRFAMYGHDRHRVCAGGGVGCWIEFDVNTEYSLAYGGIGPEIALPVLGTQLVLDATAGLGFFGVSSSLQGADDDQRIGTTNHHDDYTFAWSAGGELRIPVSRTLAISLGSHYLHNGQASYVVEGSITENPDGSLDVDPVTTDANMVAITLGVSFWPFDDRPQGWR